MTVLIVGTTWAVMISIVGGLLGAQAWAWKGQEEEA